ncbi:uncharacterized protein LOC123308333 isoform X2 [Coccinella septempunctata]|uniref:uncharacterized protein LOC123308333 isoform X2 n=1 Tax=Coccinella septempunctata TaxID=41139 RepID=UPI001D07BCF6|nr:uncharacterized protein LOC123308333 isoform X2 [Coccinella septempunctata]
MDNKSICNKRTANFSSSEEKLLIFLIKKYALVIRNKKTDSVSNKKKTAAWVEIEKEFNDAGGEPYRSSLILKNKYLNLKKTSLQKFAEEKKQTYSTGGGQSVRDNEIDGSIEEIIGIRMTGSVSEFDNDIIVEDLSDYEEDKIKSLSSTNSLDEGESFVINAEESQWSINNIEIPIDVRKRDITSRTEWLQKKQDTLTIQQKCLIDECNQKLQHLQEIHDQKLRHTEESHRQKIRMDQEEHDMKMSILKLQRQKLLNELS